MKKLNNNIQEALDSLDISDVEKETIGDILYEEHVWKDQDWPDNQAIKTIQSIVDENYKAEVKE